MLKRILVILFLFGPVAGAFGVFSAPAGAAENYAAPIDTSRPKRTSSAYVAMLFHKMAGIEPDFEQWAAASKSFAEASTFDKTLVRNEKTNELRMVYELLTVTEPIVVEAPLTLSEYSRSNQGFFITSFKDDTFFSFEFLGQHYAVIPANIMDRQWMGVKEGQADKIASYVKLKANGRAMVHLYLEPKFADSKAPLQMNGTDHWLIAADIRKMVIFNSATNRPIWESDNVKEEVNEDLTQELLNLKQ